MSRSYLNEESRIQQALDAMNELEKPNFSAVAREFGCSRYRLRARWKGRASRSTREPTNRKLSAAQELGLCQYLDKLDQIGTAARDNMLPAAANAILRKAHNDDSIPPPVVGLHWAERFLDRHPEYFKRKQKALDINRKNAHDPVFLRDWYERFKELIQEKGVQEGDCYNMDETGFRIGVGRDVRILTKDKHRQSYLASASNRESVTVIECVSGDGAVLPPMVILPGKHLLETWFTQTDIPDDFLLGTSDTGYSNDVLSYEWVKHFENHSAKRRVGAWRLLLLDGYGSHATYEFLEVCERSQIIPFCLPAHSTHLLQPLDVVLFQAYKHWHAQEVDNAARTGCEDFNKVEFLHSLTTIRQRTFQSTSIRSGFRKTGLIPYNPSIVLNKLREAVPLMRPTTPILSSHEHPNVMHPPPLTTPLTIRTLCRHGEQLKEGELSPSLRLKLTSFVKGSIAQASSGQLAWDALENTRAAETARATRQRRSRKQVQKNGVITAVDARHIVHEREEDTLNKARALIDRETARKVKEQEKLIKQHLIMIRKVGKAKIRARKEQTKWWE